MPANLVFRRKIWGARDNGIPPRSTPGHTFFRCQLRSVFLFQGSYRSWKTWKVMEFDNLDSRPGKSWNFGPDPGKSWNFMLGKLYAAELPTVLDCLTCTREKR